MTEMTHH